MNVADASRVRKSDPRRRFAQATLLFACALLGACAAVQRTPRVFAAADAPSVRPVPAQSDTLLKLMAAQFALQNNDLDAGAVGYTEAAELLSDPVLAEEATRLSLSVRNWSLAQRALARWQALAPNAPGLLQARAWIALGQNRIDAAFADLQALASRGDEQSWRLIAQTLLGAEDKHASAQLLDRLASPAHLAARETNWVAVSQLAFKLGDKSLSRRLAEAAVVRFHGADSYAWSARLALDRGDKTAARDIYAQALKRDPKSLRLRGGYAALLADSGDNAAAARALALGPQDDATYAARAAYGSRGDDKTALAVLYRELVADKSARQGKRLFLMGQVAELIEKRNEALAWYRGIGDEDERWFDAQMRMAVLLDQTGRNREAGDFLHQLQARTAEDSDQLGNVFLLEAELLARGGHPREALAVYTRALGTLPDDPRLLYARALLSVDQNDVPGAERDLRRVLALRPDDADAMNALGYTLADSSRKGDATLLEARELVRRAVELKPNEPAVIDSLGWVHYRMGDLDASLVQLRRAYEKQPDADIAAHLGEVLWVKGDREEARRIWEEGRRKDPKNKAIIEAMQRLAA